MDPLFSEFGQPSPLFEEQLEEVRGETSASLYIPQTQLLQTLTHMHHNEDNTCYTLSSSL